MASFTFSSFFFNDLNTFQRFEKIIDKRLIVPKLAFLSPPSLLPHLPQSISNPR
jgi:uncharacterized membrane protein